MSSFSEISPKVSFLCHLHIVCMSSACHLHEISAPEIFSGLGLEQYRGRFPGASPALCPDNTSFPLLQSTSLVLKFQGIWFDGQKNCFSFHIYFESVLVFIVIIIPAIEIFWIKFYRIYRICRKLFLLVLKMKITKSSLLQILYIL